MMRLEFPDLGVVIDCEDADPATNPIFKAALITYVQPLSLAVRVGRLSEEVATAHLAKAYSRGVIVGSDTEGFEDYDEERWAKWLIENPAAFDGMREALEPTEDDDISPANT